MITALLTQPYSILFLVKNFIMQPYSLRMSQILVQRYGDAGILTALLHQYYGDAAQVTAVLDQLYGDAQQMVQTLDQPYSLNEKLTAVLRQIYALAGVRLTAILDQPYAVRDVEELLVLLRQPYGLLSESSQLISTDTGVRVNGVALKYYHINVERTRDRYCITAEVHLASQADYERCRIMDSLYVEVNGTVFVLFVESRERNRGFGTAEYVIRGLSRTALLDAPYNDGVVVPDEGLTGLASAIVADLAVGYAVNWLTVDWYIPAGVLLPDDQSALAVIRDIAAAVGAVLQTEPDGTLTVEPDYPVSVPAWQTATPDYYLTDALDFFSTGENFDIREGYNRFLITDGDSKSKSVQLEEEKISSTGKYIRAYPVPWRNDFDLRHTGGNWVNAQKIGIEERLIEHEIVEFVGGEGRLSYPVLAIVITDWLQTDLGTVTAAEDGTLTAAVAAESLLDVSYMVRSWKYLVVDQQDEKLQIVSDEEAE